MGLPSFNVIDDAFADGDLTFINSAILLDEAAYAIWFSILICLTNVQCLAIEENLLNGIDLRKTSRNGQEVF